MAAALDPDQSVLKALGLNLSEAFHHSASILQWHTSDLASDLKGLDGLLGVFQAEVNRNLQAAGLEPIREASRDSVKHTSCEDSVIFACFCIASGLGEDGV